jgi:hypothetical protein
MLAGLFAGPYYANGGAVIYDPLEMLDEFIISPLVRTIANALENKIVNQVNKALGKIDGKTPSYITNWRNYILESEARGNDVFWAVLADTKLCPYFKNDLTTSFGAEKSTGAALGAQVRKIVAGQNVVVYENKLFAPGMPSLQTTANCTLPSGFNQKTFQNDFTKGGGWTTWNQLIQPQNNFFGAYSLALGEQSKQIATEKQAAQDSSLAGGGFKGQKLGADNKASPTGCTGASLPGQLAPTTSDCMAADQACFVSCNDQAVKNSAFNLKACDAACSSALNACKKSTTTSSGTRCAFLGEEVTPGSILGESAANTLDKKIGRVGTAAYLTDIILSVIGGVIQGLSDKLTNFGGKSSYGTPTTPEAGFGQSAPIPAGKEEGVPATDPNYDAQVNQICASSCQSDCEGNAPQECNTDPVTGEEQCTKDQGAVDACRQNCGSQCPEI